MAGRNNTAFRLEGFTAFRDELRAAASDLPRVVEQTDRALAEHTIESARKMAASQGKMPAKAAESLRAEKGRRGIKIRYGGDRWPYAMGAEFGSFAYHQFRGFRSNGYFVFQAKFVVERYEQADTYYRALSNALSEAFPR
ncbi:hypothetical protein [Kitasatospora sp. NPDC056800]|uniref:hypothetical protein n=1 Tax=Kitasatospora sp. NPDC056800 TaxID=3345948 RepID=UPI00369B8010